MEKYEIDTNVKIEKVEGMQRLILDLILVKPTITSNKIEITNELPANWDKYSYMDPNR